MEFAEKIDTEVKNEIKNLQEKIDKINHYYRLFGEKFSIPKKKKNYFQIVESDKIINRSIDGITFKCNVITNHKEALLYPHKPCVFKNVPDWYFFAFPELGQILPVKSIDTILDYRDNLKYTKMHYGLFRDIHIDSTVHSEYAVIPYTKGSWELFEKINKENWSKYLKQLNIGQLSINKKNSQKSENIENINTNS